MATAPASPTTRPAPPPPKEEVKNPWPTTDQEYVFDGNVTAAPEWVDRGWAGAEPAGPVLHVPVLNPTVQPYTTQPCRVGDTLKYTADKKDPKGVFGKYTVTPKEPEEPKSAA